MNREEFEETLKTPVEYWSKLSKEEVKELLGVDVAKMVGFDQHNPHHCYELFDHCLHTVEALADEDMLLKVAGFFHDIGKPLVAKEKQGRLVFYGHADVSNKVAKDILKKLGYNGIEIAIICFYIKHHDDFISWMLEEESYNKKNPYLVEINEKNVKDYLVKNDVEKEMIEELIKLCIADASSQAIVTYQNGKEVSSRALKVKKAKTIQSILQSI